MPKTASKPVRVTARIERGPGSPAQRQQWKRWWSKLFSEIRDEGKSERKPTIVNPNGPAQSSVEMREDSDAQG